MKFLSDIIQMNNRDLAHDLDELDRLVAQLYAQVSNDPSPASEQGQKRSPFSTFLHLLLYNFTDLVTVRIVECRWSAAT